jgi:hypothetical protein
LFYLVVGEGSIFAFMFIILLFSLVLQVIVTDFVFSPDFPEESNDTFNFPSSPGLMGVLGYSGTVQPQEPLASEISKSA